MRVAAMNVRTRNNRIPGEVFACLLPGELRIIVCPGVGHVDGGVPWNAPLDRVPAELRMPNTRLWLHVDDAMNVLRVSRREE
jgi:hypothetical protein